MVNVDFCEIWLSTKTNGVPLLQKFHQRSTTQCQLATCHWVGYCKSLEKSDFDQPKISKDLFIFLFSELKSSATT